MSLIEKLLRVLDYKGYSNVTFYLRGIPITTVMLGKDKNVILITNNMKELRYNVVPYNENVDNFVKEVEDTLVYNGVDELIKRSKGFKIEFNSEPYLKGEISENKITIDQVDVDVDDKDGEVTITKRYGITTVIEMKAKTVAEVIGALTCLRFT